MSVDGFYFLKKDESRNLEEKLYSLFIICINLCCKFKALYLEFMESCLTELFLWFYDDFELFLLCRIFEKISIMIYIWIVLLKIFFFYQYLDMSWWKDVPEIENTESYRQKVSSVFYLFIFFN